MLAAAVLSVSLGFNLYHLYAAYFGPPGAHTFRSIHVSMLMILAFFTRPLAKSQKGRLKEYARYLDFS